MAGFLWLLCLVWNGTAAAQGPNAPPPEAATPRIERPCRELAEKERRRTERCKTDDERLEDERERRRKEAEARERDERSSFLKWIHTDALWVPGQQGTGTYGIVGMHLAVAQVGRIYLYGPPGVMLVREETSRGPMFRSAFTWGVSYALTDIKVPGKATPAVLHLNIVKAWTNGSYSNGITMLGLSMTWKK